MNASNAIRFFLRHFIASIITIAVPIGLLVFFYVVLLFVAIIGNLPLGSPVFLPLTGLAVFVIGVVSTSVFLFPAVWFSEVVSGRLGWSPITQMFVSTIALFALVHLIFAPLRLLLDYQQFWCLQFANHPLAVSLSLMFPLGLYWWSAKAIELSTWGVSRLWQVLGSIFKKQNSISLLTIL